jgi:hypothetical protein
VPTVGGAQSLAAEEVEEKRGWRGEPRLTGGSATAESDWGPNMCDLSFPSEPCTERTVDDSTLAGSDSLIILFVQQQPPAYSCSCYRGLAIAVAACTGDAQHEKEPSTNTTSRVRRPCCPSIYQYILSKTCDRSMSTSDNATCTSLMS